MNFNQLMKQAQLMQRKVNKVKKEFDTKEYDFESQNKAITGKINGKLELTKLNIDSKLLNNESKELLEDMILVSVNEAIRTMNSEKEKAINEASGGVDMAGLF